MKIWEAKWQLSLPLQTEVWRDLLHPLALQAQAYDDAHPHEFSDFNNTITDGLDPNETFDLAKLDALCQK